MNLTVLVKIIHNQSTVHIAPVGGHICIRSNNDTSRRRGKIAAICTEVPHNICTGSLKISIIDISDSEIAAGVILSIDIENNAYAVVVQQQLFNFRLDIRRINKIVCVDVDNKRLTRRYPAVLNGVVCVVKGLTNIYSGGLLHCGNKIAARSADLVQSTGDIVLLLLRSSPADSNVLSLYIKDLILNSACLEAHSVAVVHVGQLKVKPENQLKLGVAGKISKLYRSSLRGCRVKIGHKVPAHVRAVCDHICIVLLNRVDLAHSRVCLQVVGGHSFGIKSKVLDIVKGFIVISDRLRLVCSGKYVIGYLIVG